MVKRVYVTRMLPAEAIDLLRERYEVDINTEDRVLERSELMSNIRGRDAVLSLLTDRIDSEVMDAAGPGCRIIANYAVGFDNIDKSEATKRGIIITNTPDVLTDAAADIAWALLFAVSRRIVEADRFIRGGKFRGWGPMLFLGRDITGKTLGLIGCGRIGSNFAKKSKGFNMRIIYNSSRPVKDFEKQTGAVFQDLETVLRDSDFISIHVPLLPATRHMIGEKELKLMKKTAILINTSRGPVVDEKALVKALRNREIWGAGLDVFENEPYLEPGLCELDNVVIVPHIASATIETRTKMALIAARNIISVLDGGRPQTCINPEVLKK